MIMSNVIFVILCMVLLILLVLFGIVTIAALLLQCIDVEIDVEKISKFLKDRKRKK